MQPSPTRREFLLGIWPFSLFFRRDPRMAGTTFETIRHGDDRRRYLWIHGNERTAAEVLREHMRYTHGRAFLVRSPVRYIPLDRGRLDPNRMFTRAGASRNLRSLNPEWDGERLTYALDRLDRDRPGFLRRVIPDKRRLLVALHNNSEGYSVKDEVSISGRVSLADAAHPHEFMLCTHPADFDRLAAGPFNVVLQDNPEGEDDGSLSRWCASSGLRYVNIEAALGNRTGQIRMLEWLERQLPEEL